jgi:hypothetical protein
MLVSRDINTRCPRMNMHQKKVNRSIVVQDTDMNVI